MEHGKESEGHHKRARCCKSAMTTVAMRSQAFVDRFKLLPSWLQASVFYSQKASGESLLVYVSKQCISISSHNLNQKEILGLEKL